LLSRCNGGEVSKFFTSSSPPHHCQSHHRNVTSSPTMCLPITLFTRKPKPVYPPRKLPSHYKYFAHKTPHQTHLPFPPTPPKNEPSAQGKANAWKGKMYDESWME